MSTSTDAMLFYGFEIPGGEDGKVPFWVTDENNDVEEFIAAKLGVLAPTVKYSEETKPLFKTYWDAKSEAIVKLKVTVEQHCHIDAPMYVIAVKLSMYRANRGYPEKLVAAHFIVDPAWDEQLREFTKLVGIEMGEPSWILSSYWG